MDMLRAILKNKLFYVVVVIAFLVNRAMNFNDAHNQDLLDKYYESSVVGATTFQHQNNLRDRLAAYSRTLLGKPYQYAAKGPDRFDCSGFTGYVFKNFNIKLPASSALQATFGEARDTEYVQKGDLLIFKGPNMDEVGHVGIVIANQEGKIHFIHSSTSRGVIIDDLDHPYYKKRYICARNVLQE